MLRSFIIAVSMYSKIPVPQSAWREEDMRYVFCFFPWVGALIGGCIYGWNVLCGIFAIGNLCRTVIMAAIPILLTGGIHVDGFMDTMDAFHSYQSKERKLEILKDSHIGAFAVIMFAAYGLVFLGALSEIGDDASLKILCGGFFLSRCLCGISALSFPPAKQEGTLCLFVNQARKRAVRGVLYLQSALCAGVMLYWSLPVGLSVMMAAVLALAYYHWRSEKEFGGVTGDTSGYFVFLSEGWMAAAAAVAQYMFF